MIRVCLVFVLLLATAEVLAQDYLYLEPKWVERNMTALRDSIYGVRLDSTGMPEKLIAYVDGTEPFVAEFWFEDPYGFELRCDSIVYRYSCGSCFDAQLDRVLSSNQDDWLQMHDNRYIKNKSSYWEKGEGDNEKTTVTPMLTVIRTPGEAMCGTLIYSYLRLPKKAHKQLTKDLRCSGMYYPFGQL